MKQRCAPRIYVALLLLLLALPSTVLAAQGYEVSATYIRVFGDGSAEVLVLIEVSEPPQRIALRLLAQPLYIEAYSDGQPVPVDVSGATAYLVATGSNVTVRYITTGLTSKEGEYWVLKFVCVSETSVILPENAYVLEIAPENFSVALVNSTVALVFPPGSSVEVRYFLLPAPLARRTAPATTPVTSSPTIPTVVGATGTRTTAGVTETPSAAKTPTLIGGATPTTGTVGGTRTTAATSVATPVTSTTATWTAAGGFAWQLPLAAALAAALAIALAILLLRRRSPAPAPSMSIERAGLDDRDEAIVKALKSGPLSAQEIMERTGIPKTPLYRRLKKLERMGVVESFSRGGKTFYKLRRAEEPSHQR